MKCYISLYKQYNEKDGIINLRIINNNSIEIKRKKTLIFIHFLNIYSLSEKYDPICYPVRSPHDSMWKELSHHLQTATDGNCELYRSRRAPLPCVSQPCWAHNISFPFSFYPSSLSSFVFVHILLRSERLASSFLPIINSKALPSPNINMEGHPEHHRGPTFSPEHIEILITIERVGAGCSMIAIILVLLTFGLFKKLRTTPNLFLIFASIANAGASVASMIGYDGLERGEGSHLCQAQAFIFEWYDIWLRLWFNTNLFPQVYAVWPLVVTCHGYQCVSRVLLQCRSSNVSQVCLAILHDLFRWSFYSSSCFDINPQLTWRSHIWRCYCRWFLTVLLSLVYWQCVALVLDRDWLESCSPLRLLHPNLDIFIPLHHDLHRCWIPRFPHSKSDQAYGDGCYWQRREEWSYSLFE